MRDPAERLQDILEAIDRIQIYSSQGRQSFEDDELIQTWIVRHLQIIGEAARVLPKNIKEHAPDVPWTKIIGMRHILVHDYFYIDSEVVWEVVDKDLPQLRTTVEKLLHKITSK